MIHRRGGWEESTWRDLSGDRRRNDAKKAVAVLSAEFVSDGSVSLEDKIPASGKAVPGTVK